MIAPDTRWPIGTAARMLGVSVDTLRIWEGKGRIESAGRTDGGHRLYSQAEVDRLLKAQKRDAAKAKASRELAEGMQS